MKKVICFLFGHDYHIVEIDRTGVGYRCKRCKEEKYNIFDRINPALDNYSKQNPYGIF